ncbi:DsrE/DsrF/DrsH-like family protein [bacterium]|nr:DsrE/DsrF/DrsH-like family protein [bacterium]RQV98307.1 MAG: NAD(FAD)-dependent dehydrogenase [bacterium]
MDKATIVVHSGDLDKVMSALIIGNGYLAMGGEVTLYFTFWGLQRLIKGRLSKAPLSRMHFFGLGTWMMKRKMKKANVAPPEKLMADFKALGGRIIACEMTMEVMGISKSDLDETLIDEYGAVGMYVNESKKARMTLFI